MERLESIYLDKDAKVCTLYFENLEIEIVTKVYPATRWEPEDYDSVTAEEDYEYEIDFDELYEFLRDFLPSGMQDISDEEADKYITEHLDEMVKENKKDIEKRYLDDARERAQDYYQDEFDNGGPDDYDEYVEYMNSRYEDYY